MFVGAILFLVTFCLVFNWKLNHRMLKNSRRTKINYYKYCSHFMDIIFFPLVYNMSLYSSCNWYSTKKAIIPAECSRDHENAWGMMLIGQVFAGAVGIAWTVLIGVHLYRENISNILHEEYIIRKEMEYIVNLSDNWLTRYFFMFSSYKSDVFKMYNRVIFNGMVLLQIFLANYLDKSSENQAIAITFVFGFYALYLAFSRPFRCVHSNILAFTLTVTIGLNSFTLTLKRQGLESALLVDHYMFALLCIINVFMWFLVICHFILMFCLKSRWPVTKQKVLSAIKDQDVAILAIQRARKLVSTF